MLTYWQGKSTLTRFVARLEDENVYVCVCKGIRFSEAVETARSKGSSPDQLMNAFGFDDGDCCGRCANHINRLSVNITRELGKSRLSAA